MVVVVVVNASKVSIWLHQVYMSVSVSEVRIAVHSFAVCVHDVNEWMRASRLRLNPTKTQVMWLGSGQQLKHVDINDIPLLSTTVHVAESVRDLGVILGSHLTLSAHVAALCWCRYYQLRQLHPLVQSMTVEAARTAAAACISCRLHCHKLLLYGLPDTLLHKLQSEQNATARLMGCGVVHWAHWRPQLRWQHHPAKNKGKNKERKH